MSHLFSLDLLLNCHFESMMDVLNGTYALRRAIDHADSSALGRTYMASSPRLRLSSMNSDKQVESPITQ